MKRIVASVGLVAVGASSLQAALLPSMTTESGKPWTLSATLRGFYDDNFNTVPDNVQVPHRSTYGFEVSPALMFNFPMEQTTLSFGYIYSLKYYEYKPINSTDYYDQTHDFNAALTHAFSERYSLSIKDSLVVGQEPDLLRAGNTYTTFQRISGSNLRNYGSIDFTAQVTPEFSLDVGYANTYYSYADNLVTITPNLPPPAGTGGFTVLPSNAGLMDEIDNVAHIDGRYQLQPQTIGIVGVQFRETDYIGNQPIFFNSVTGHLEQSDIRNARSYYGYVGLDHNFRPDLTGSIRGGAYWTDYYNDPTSQNQAAPYAMANLQYTYLPESYIQIGGSYDYSESSAFNPNPATGSPTLNAQTGTVFANLRHRIMPKLYGSILAQYQNSTYYGGSIDGNADNYYVIGLNLQYRFTPNFSAEVGYDYDKLDAGVNYFGAIGNGSYDRNRVYIGVTGSY
jgi:Putative beta-barrel porin 2